MMCVDVCVAGKCEVCDPAILQINRVVVTDRGPTTKLTLGRFCLAMLWRENRTNLHLS